MVTKGAWVGVCVGVVAATCFAWFLNWAYLRPKRLERHLRRQGIPGTSYKLFHGDSKLMSAMKREAMSKPISFDGDIIYRVMPGIRHFVHKHGETSFFWIGPTPKILITDPKMAREILTKYKTFKKGRSALLKLVLPGIVSLEGEEWAKRRRALNPAFYLDKLKDMFPAFQESCNELMHKWEMLLTMNNASIEIDAWTYLTNLAGDIISRAAFGSSFEEAKKIFQLHKEQADILAKNSWGISIPLWRFLPTNANKRIKELNNEIKGCIQNLIGNKDQALNPPKACHGGLLRMMLDSQPGSMNFDQVVEECKLFYFAGAETTAVLLTWVMVLLSRHQDWQTHAREEVLDAFGRNTPHFDGLNRLKVVTMIMNETLRLYPPVPAALRRLYKPTRIGQLWLPAGVELLLPVMLMHSDEKIWGDDSKVFNPARFSEGIAKATKGEVAFFPFSHGPRICIGLNFAIMELKLAISMILQRFYLELSPSYAHAPYSNLTLQPQHGTHIILHKIALYLNMYLISCSHFSFILAEKYLKCETLMVE